LKYARPSDIITADLTWTAPAGTVSSDTDYGLASLYDEQMAKPTKFTDVPAVAIRVVGDAGVATRVDGMALPNSKNIPAGTVMKAQMGNDPTFATYAVSVDVTMGASGLDGHVASPWANFVAASGYSVSGYRYVSWYVPAVASAPWLGELLVMSHLREFSVWPQFGTRGQTVPFLENIYTEYGVRRVTKRLIRQRRVSYPFRGRDTDFDDLQALVQDCGGVATPFFLVANSTVKTDGGLYGRLTPESAKTIEGAEEWYDLTNFNVVFEEDSRSIPF
jgi:hypothetical protein